jgi:hypothetical protein
MLLILWHLAFLSPIFALVGAIFLYRQHCLRLHGIAAEAA